MIDVKTIEFPNVAILSYAQLREAGLTNRQIVSWVTLKYIAPIKQLPYKYQEYYRTDIIKCIAELGTKRGRPKGSLNKKVKA